MELLELFCSYHPEFMNSLSQFPEISKKRILKKLKQAKTKSSFRSTVSEIRFGEFFLSLGLDCEYDKCLENQTPDWTINIFNQFAICEVYRLGQSASDQILSDFESLLIEKIKEIPSNLGIKIKFNKENFNITDNEIINEVTLLLDHLKSWILLTSPKLNEELQVRDFRFRVVSILNDSKFTACIGPAMSIDYKIEKLRQVKSLKPNEITKKMHKYTDLVTRLEIPFFICVDIDFISGFNHDEFEEHFLGSGAAFFDYDPQNPILFDGEYLGSEWTKLGEFYQNIQLSGIITRVNNTVKVLINPIKKQKIHDLKYKDLLTKITTTGNSGFTQLLLPL